MPVIPLARFVVIANQPLTLPAVEQAVLKFMLRTSDRIGYLPKLHLNKTTIIENTSSMQDERGWRHMT
jgi:hypothetical protein